MELLYFFESIRNPVLDVFMSIVTFFGSEVAFLVFALAVYWCIDKPRGIYVISVGFVGVIICQALKILCMIPRPWVLDPNFTTVGAATEDAAGYSFPSGHTQNSTGTYGGIARFSRAKWARIACIALMVLVPISRMYLGVHTPLDVGVSLLIGLILVFSLYPLFELTRKKPDLVYWILGVFFLISILFLVFALCFPFPSDIDTANLYELRKNAFTLLGSVGGAFMFFPIEKKFIKFDVKASLPIQALKLTVGFATVLAVKEGLKVVFNLLSGGDELLWLRSIRYFAVVAVATTVCPLIFKLFGKIKAKKSEQ